MDISDVGNIHQISTNAICTVYAVEHTSGVCETVNLLILPRGIPTLSKNFKELRRYPPDPRYSRDKWTGTHYEGTRQTDNGYIGPTFDCLPEGRRTIIKYITGQEDQPRKTLEPAAKSRLPRWMARILEAVAA